MKSILLALLAAACSKSAAPTPTTPTTPTTPEPVEAPAAPVANEPPPEPAAPKTARVELAPTAKSKSKVKGTITFREVDGGVEVTAEVEGLKAGKQHAWHIHETGDCSAPDATSAGDHFNPGGHKHGAPEAEDRHEGDFGNLLADKLGKASKTFTMAGITVAPGATSIVGKGFIIHAKPDDLKTQPSGNAGDRIACGVIEAQ
jgi:Cu-Zn family superoxide dismutase